MAVSNITVSVTEPTVSISQDLVNVSVASTISNVVVGNAITTSTSDIRLAIGNTLPITYNNVTGIIGFSSNLDDLTLKKYQETIVSGGTTSGDISVNIADGTIHTITLDGNVTGLTLSNISTGGSATFILTQDGGGGRIIDTTTTPSNWTNWNFVNESSDIDTNPSAWSIMNVFYDGTNYYASISEKNALQVENSSLANSNIIVNGTTIDLGSSGNISNFGTLTTDDLTEGSTNLYYTDSRFDTRLATKTTDNLTEGSTNLYFTNARANTVIGTNTTDNLTEGATNLYYTTARANSAISTYFGDSGNFPFNFAGNLTVSGDVVVSGNLDYENVTDLYVTDQKITLNANAATDATVEIIANRPVAGANTVLRWNETDDKWQFSNDGSTYEDISGLTNTQAQSYIQSSGLTMTADISTGNNLDFTGSTPILTMTEAGKIRIGNISNSNSPILSFLPGNMHKYTITDQDSDNFGVLYQEGVEHYKNDDDGIKVMYAKGRGNISVPAGPIDGDRVFDEFFMHYNSTKFTDRSNFGQSGRFVFYDADVATYDDNTMPLTQEFYSFLNGNLTSGSPISLLRMASDGTISFNGDATREDFTSAPVTITRDGNVTSSSKIQGGTLTDGTLTTTGGTLTGALSITSTTLSDGIFSVTGGNFSTVGNIDATGYFQTNGLIKTFGGDIETTTGNIITLANINAGGGTLTGVVTSDSNIETSAFFIGDLDGAVTIDVNNNTGVTLNKGEAVYLTGGNSGDNPNVALADADDATKMPALGIVRENISATPGTIGQVVTSGVMNFASHGFTPGADLFISTTAGALSETAPTGETGLIQKIGKVVSSNHILVQGAFRQNQVPNLNQDNIFIGNATNQATTVSLTGLTSNLKTTGNVQINPDTLVGGLKGFTFDSATNRLGLGTTTPETALHIVSDDDFDSQIYMDEYKTTSTGNDIRFRKAEGTLSAPRFIGSGNSIGQIFSYGWRENADPTGNAAFSDTYGGSFATTGGIEIASFADGDYLVHHLPVGNLTAQGGALGDRLRLTDQTIRFNDGTIFVLDGTTNANLTSLNGQAFYVDQQGGSTSRTYDLYYDEARTNPVQVATGTEDFTDGNANVVSVAQPIGMEIILQDGSSPNRFGTRRITKLRANGTVEFGATSTDDGTGAAASITTDGVFTTTGNISGDNVIGNYLYGDGTNISGIGGSVNSFETITVSGGSSVVADSSTDTLTLVASGAITLTADTANDTITIGGSGGSYGDGNVTTLLEGNTVTTNIVIQGFIESNKDVKAANAIFSDEILSYTPGGTVTFTSARFSDAGFGGGNYFFPDVGGDTVGGVLQSQANSIGFFSNSISNLNTLTADDVIIRDRLQLKSYSNTDILALTGLTAGEVVFNSTDNLVAYYDGTNWRNIAQGAIVT